MISCKLGYSGLVWYCRFQNRLGCLPKPKEEGASNYFSLYVTIDTECFRRIIYKLRLVLQLLSGLLLLVGCTHAIRIPLDGTPLSKDQSTVVIWMDQKPMLINEDVPLFFDSRRVGKVSAKVPLKFQTNPGRHTIYASLSGIIIDRIIEVDLKPGEVTFYRTYVQCGMWVCSVYTSPTKPSPYYDSVIHKFHDN